LFVGNHEERLEAMKGSKVQVFLFAAFVCACARPATLLAQRGILNGIGRGPGTVAREPGVEIPKYVNPVNLLIEHRPGLALTDSQFARIIVIKRLLDSTNGPLVRRLDSIQHLFKGGLIFSEPSRARRDSLADARVVVQQTIADIKDNISSGREKAYSLLSATQLAHATEYEESAQRAIDDEAKKGDKGRGGRRSGRPPTTQ
jgi:hypothetical protein